MAPKRSPQSVDSVETRKRQKVAHNDASTPDDVRSETNVPSSDAPQTPPNKASPTRAASFDTVRSAEDDLEPTYPQSREPAPLNLDGMDPTLQTRIEKLRKYVDSARGVYYVQFVPDKLHFGHDQAFDMTNYLTRDDNVPILIWIVGRVMARKFAQDRQGNWPDQVYLSVQPLTKDDTRAATRVANMYSRPRQFDELNPFGSVIANRIQKPFNSDAPAKEFTAVFDARVAMKPKKDLAQYPASDLKKGDLVLCEMRVKKRFDHTDLGTPKKDKPWTISFTLNAVYLLQDAPVPDDDDSGVTYDF